MSTESATAVVERIKSDESFRNDVMAAPDAEARYAMLNDAGFDVSPADEAVLVKGLEQAPVELSDEQLESASGAGGFGGAGELGFAWTDYPLPPGVVS